MCPHCGTTRTGDVARIKERRNPLDLKCTCQSTFRVLIEHRKSYRKEVQIESYYLKLPSTTERGVMAVRNISLGGIGFTISKSAKHNFSEGDCIWVTFELDDERQSKIEQCAVVTYVKDRHIGCEFTKLSEQNRKLLGLYLMS